MAYVASKPWGAAWGRVAGATTTTDTALTTTIADVTNVTVTFTAIAGRRYQIVTGGRVTTASGTINVFGIVTDGSNVQQGRSFQCELTASGQQDLFGVVETTPAGGSITYKLRANTGSGTATLDAASGFEHFIFVYDVGPV